MNSSNARSSKTPHVNLRKVAEAKGYTKVSSLAIFPDFLPGLGVFYVKPEALPYGPLLSFDRQDRLVATVYMIPVQDINDHKKLDLSGFGGRSDHVTFYFQPGHVGADMPHYYFFARSSSSLVARPNSERLGQHSRFNIRNGAGLDFLLNQHERVEIVFYGT